MPSEQKKLPIGIQSFEKLINEGAVYVDKTKYIYELLKSGFGAYFLSRPRRFGKSLLVSTLEAIFKNKRSLFKGLWLDSSEYAWKEFPVIKFDMSVVPQKTDLELIVGLKDAVKDNAKNEQIVLEESDSPGRMFQSLIHALVKKYGEKVVVLIDEYDDPIIKHVTRPEMAARNREVLHDFYKIMKAEDANLRFVFLTGISKFVKTSISSGLNNLENISLLPEYSPLLGYTQDELETYFGEYISDFAEMQSLTVPAALEGVKLWYNGYRFSESEIKVYNPFSSLLFFKHKKITNYWFETGTPTYLVDLIKKKLPEIKDFEDGVRVLQRSFESYEIESLPIIPLLYDTGYLTIKDCSKSMIQDYILAYPNLEVKSSMLDSLLLGFSEAPMEEIDNIIFSIRDAISTSNLDDFFFVLKSYFASIPYDLIPKKNLGEKYFQLIFYLLMRVSSFRVNTEDRTNLGR
ncbi:MAG: AAA family ATPase, partial [bacterium]